MVDGVRRMPGEPAAWPVASRRRGRAGTAGAADHHLGGEHATLGAGGGAGDPFVEAVGGEHPELVHRLAHGGQAGAHVARRPSRRPSRRRRCRRGRRRRRRAAGPCTARASSSLAQTRASAVKLAGEQPVGDGGAVALAELGRAPARPASGPRAAVGGDEAGVALEEVGGGVGVTDEAQVGAAVLEAGARSAAGRSRRSRRAIASMPCAGVAGDDDDRLGRVLPTWAASASRAPRCRRPGWRGCAPRGRGRSLALGQHQHDALAELGGARLEADRAARSSRGRSARAAPGRRRRGGARPGCGPRRRARSRGRRRRRAPCGGSRSDTTVEPWSTRETVAMETPARSATE